MTIPVPIHPATNPSFGIGVAIVTLVVLAATILTAITLIRKFLHHDSSSSSNGWSNAAPDVDNPSSFMAAFDAGRLSKNCARRKKNSRV